MHSWSYLYYDYIHRPWHGLQIGTLAQCMSWHDCSKLSHLLSSPFCDNWSVDLLNRITAYSGDAYSYKPPVFPIVCGKNYIHIHIRGRYWHDDVIKWKHFPRYWPFVRGIHRWAVNSPHKSQWRWVLLLSLICTWTNRWVNNRRAGDLGRHRAHFDVTVTDPVLCRHVASLGKKS